MKAKWIAVLLPWTLVWAQTPAPAPKPAAPKTTGILPAGQPAPKPAPAPAAKPAPVPAAKPATPPAAKPAPAAASPVDTVIELVKGGLSEDMIVQTLKSDNKPVKLAPADLLKLSKAGVSQRIIQTMMNPSADVASTPAPAPTPAKSNPDPAPAPSGGAQVQNASLPPPPPPAPRKRKIAVYSFDDSAVLKATEALFGTRVNVGRGIQALFVKRLAEAQKFTVLERSKVNEVMKEQDFGASNRVKQGTQAKIGRIIGADAQVFGDLVVFGRDDRKVDVKGFGIIGRAGGAVANSMKTDKANVVINYRIVDAETSEIIFQGEAKGESKRKSKGFGAIAGALGGAVVGGSIDMTSSNFAETIIGEATIDCVDKLVADLVAKYDKIPEKKIDIEGRVAEIQGNTLYVNVGSNDSVQVGDRFEVLKIVKEVLDPQTKEVLDLVTEPAGELVITNVRDRLSSGVYSGPGAKVNYAVRKRMQ
jgi:curli biogenesis system outer membrane secretion channel CsgG